jgi:hypothetical protein
MSISRPGTAASTSTFSSLPRARSRASGSAAQSSTLDTPMLEPSRAGLTNTGSPSRARSRGPTSCWPPRSTTPSATARPAAAAIRFVHSLSMPTALAATPLPT